MPLIFSDSVKRPRGLFCYTPLALLLHRHNHALSNVDDEEDDDGTVVICVQQS